MERSQLCAPRAGRPEQTGGARQPDIAWLPLFVLALLLLLEFDGSHDRISIMLSHAEFCFSEIIGTIDKCNMCISLWIIPECDIIGCVNLFRKEAQMASIGKQAFKERTSLRYPSLHGQVIDEPEGTDGESAFITSQAIIGLLDTIPIDETLLVSELLHNTIHR